MNIRTFNPVKNEVVIHIDFTYNGRTFYKSTEANKCKGDKLDLQDAFRQIYQHTKALKNNRPDLISDKLISEDMLPLSTFKLDVYVIKFAGKINNIPVNLEFTDAEQFLDYLTDNYLISDYAATNLYAVHYPKNPFNAKESWAVLSPWYSIRPKDIEKIEELSGGDQDLAYKMMTSRLRY